MRKEIKLVWMLLSVALLSSCTESKYPEYVKEGKHVYKFFKTEELVSVIHTPECEKKDMITLLDSLNKINH